MLQIKMPLGSTQAALPSDPNNPINTESDLNHPSRDGEIFILILIFSMLPWPSYYQKIY